MKPEDPIADLEERVHRLTLMDELDKQKAKAVRAERTTEKRELDAERLTLRARQDGKVYALAEEITDPIKFQKAIKAGIFHRFGGEFFVMVDAARELGYTIIEE